MSSDLPDTWRVRPLGEIATVAWGDTSTTKASYVEAGYTAYSASGPDGYLPDFDFDGDGVVLSAIGANSGRIFFATGRWSCIKNTIQFRATDEANTRFLYYATSKPSLWPRRGSAQPFISLGDARKVPIAVPPVDEQRRISSVLGALDDKIEHCLRLASRTDATWIAQATHLAADAKQVRASELIESGILVIGDGYRAKNSELQGGKVAFLRAGNLTASGIDVADAERVPDELVERVGAKQGALWDTAFTSKGTVGRITLVSTDADPFIYSPQVCFWRSTNHAQLSPFALHAWMRSNAFVRQVNAVKGQTDMADYVSLRDQRSMLVSLPDTEAQVAIHAFAEPLARRASASRTEARRLCAIRDELLPKLISGKLRVAEDFDPDAALVTVGLE